jgi:hypothetical protein
VCFDETEDRAQQPQNPGNAREETRQLVSCVRPGLQA